MCLTLCSPASVGTAGILFGVSFASILFLLVATMITSIAGVTSDKTMPGSAWELGVLVGTCLPDLLDSRPVPVCYCPHLSSEMHRRCGE